VTEHNLCFRSKKYVQLTLYYLKIGLDIAGYKPTDLADLHNTGITTSTLQTVSYGDSHYIKLHIGIILSIKLHLNPIYKKAAFFRSQICPPGLSREHCRFGQF